MNDILMRQLALDFCCSPEEAAEYVKDTMSGAQYLDIKEVAWEELLDYFKGL